MLNEREIIIRLVLASIFGALIGLERERKDWSAGLRTHMMVCVGSSLIMMVSAFGFSDIIGTQNVTLDPSRIAAQVISGIGFIGAGTILVLRQGSIRGLTTASGLWTVAAIGLATGGGMYFAACAATVIALVILWALQPIEKIFSKRFKRKTLRIVTNLTVDNVELLKNLITKDELKIHSFSLEKNEYEYVFLIKYDNVNMLKINNTISELKENSAIKEIFWGQ